MGWDKKHSQFILDAMKWKLVLILRDKAEEFGSLPLHEEKQLRILESDIAVRTYDLQSKERKEN